MSRFLLLCSLALIVTNGLAFGFHAVDETTAERRLAPESEALKTLKSIAKQNTNRKISTVVVVGSDVTAVGGVYIKIAEPKPRSNSVNYFYEDSADIIKAAEELGITIVHRKSVKLLPIESDSLCKVLREAGLVREDSTCYGR